MSKYIKRAVVSTDSEEIAQIAKSYGANVPFLRLKELARDKSGDIGFVEHAIKYFYENENCIPEYLVHLRPTTPLRNVDIVDKGIEACINRGECCSLRSGHMASESPYKWFLKNGEGYFKSVSEGVDNDSANNGRQGFPDVYIPDGYVDVLKSSYIIENNHLHGEKMLAFESPVCSEIDTLDDLDYIRYQIEKNGSEIYDYLKSNY
jgi:N-acylneuraminate cytidylyltransferase